MRKQNALDVMPTSARTGCPIAIRRATLDDEDEKQAANGVFIARVVVRYREEHELEQALLDVAIQSRTAGELAGRLCAGGTPPRRNRADEDEAEANDGSIEELASVLGEDPKDVKARVLECYDRCEPFLPARVRDLLGRERVYEVRSACAGAALTAIRSFILRVATAGKWTHWGIIEGTVEVELPLAYDVKFVDTPGIDASQFSLKRLRRVIGAEAEERFGMFIYVCGKDAPKESEWSALHAMGTLKKIVTEGPRLCLCWPVELVVNANGRPDGFVTNLQIKKFQDRTLKMLRSDSNHWRERLDQCIVASKVDGLRGDLRRGMALAFVRAFKPDASTILKYSMYQLAFSVEEELKPSPPSDNGSGVLPSTAVVADAKPSTDPCPKTKRKIDEEAATKASPPKKRLKKQPRQCTIADPFVFNEDDGLFADEDAATPPMFGKHIAKTKSTRSPLVDANEKSRATAAARRKTKPSNTAPKRPLVLTSTTVSPPKSKHRGAEAPQPKLSPQLSATPASKPARNRPKFVVASVDDGPTPSPPPARPKRPRECTKQPWWVVQSHQ